MAICMSRITGRSCSNESKPLNKGLYRLVGLYKGYGIARSKLEVGCGQPLRWLFDDVARAFDVFFRMTEMLQWSSNHNSMITIAQGDNRA